MINLIEQDNTIVIKLTNNENKEVFMQYSYSPRINSQLIVIEVKTFKKYWGRNKYDEWSKYASESEYELRQDYKFEYAERGFYHGDKDPVPIAEISLLNNTTETCIGIIEGITRTIWLIASGYKLIPFEIRHATSDFLLDKGLYTLKEIME